MRLADGLSATVIAVGAALTALAAPVAASAGASPPPQARPTTAAVAIPSAGSVAASMIGGPLMASQGTVVEQPAQGGMPPPNIPASAWVIANASTGQVLAAKDPHGEFGPASTLKVLTAITLIPLLNPNGMAVTSQLAASQEPASAGLVPGRAYQVSDLFDALLLISANDAAVALTQATGSLAGGMALINAEARKLQAYDVDAKLPNGLPAAGQVTSAYDEALIARQALAMPAFMRYDETLSRRFEIKPGDWETLINQNYLLTKYKGGIGGKIGWTVSSEATYVGMARRGGVTLIATVLHCTSLQEITSAERLLTWGFAMNGKVTPVGTLVPPLATATVAQHPHADVATRTVALSAAQPGSGASRSSYVLAATGVVVAGLGLGSLARTRRRTVVTRHRPQLTADPAWLASVRSRPGPNHWARITVPASLCSQHWARSTGPSSLCLGGVCLRLLSLSLGLGLGGRPAGCRIRGSAVPPGAQYDRHGPDFGDRARSGAGTCGRALPGSGRAFLSSGRALLSCRRALASRGRALPS
jgi:D-alanyl-D-alanine carboxypeptidase (penicillin-binding protein 5/6)